MLNRFKGVLASFDSHDVRYVVISGVAAILHGVPRATFDLDILIEASEVNARRLLAALEEAGMGTAVLTTPKEIVANAVTVFDDRMQLDVQTDTPGLIFEQVWARRETLDYEGQRFYILSKSDVIASKMASGRDVDLEDVRQLRLDEDDATEDQA